MKKFTLEIQTDNAAFKGDPAAEIATILEQCVDKVRAGRREGPLYDVNGNRVGMFRHAAGKARLNPR